MSAAAPIHLLWTGGWDSTFRLLQLVLGEGRPVQPHYLISVNRRSTGEELRAMAAIKHKLFDRSRQARELLCPTCFAEIADLALDRRVSESMESIRRRIPLGPQYDWLARYCIQNDLQAVELAVEQGGLACQVLDTLVTRQEDGCWVDPANSGTPEGVLFGRYRFPVFDLNKADMEKIARREGWLELLELTWFCHYPRANHTPCGVCNPCCCVMEEGMARRMPLAGKLRYYLTLRPLARKDTRFSRLARRKKRRVIPIKDSGKAEIKPVVG